MAVAKGRSFLVYVGDDDAVVTGSAVIADLAKWTLVAGAQERSMTVTNDCLLYTSPSPRD